ncbi:MAG: cystathionine gamma-synthase [Actinomycetota bacterium]|nr:cystathionine gamma-synthase [Actinomycetota bacterium]
MGAPAGDDGLSNARFETLAIHAGQEPEKLFGAVNVPIYQTATYAQDEVGSPKRWDYARGGNPTREALEVALAALEGGVRGFAFGSGMGAEATLLMTLRPGDHVVLADDAYGGTYRLLSSVLAPWQLGSSTADLRDPSALEAQITSATKIVWVETPSNPLLKIVDIPAVAAVAHDAGARVVVDNTFATPALQRPLALGADAVVHSTTKYIGGHSDLIGGAIVTSDPNWIERLAFLTTAVGAVPGPMDCYLALRGLKTLAIRMRAHGENARAIANHLAGHPKVTRVNYPGLATHPGHDVAMRQMSGFGGMVSFEVDSAEEALRVARRTRLFFLAESLGGVESLIEVPGPMTHASVAGSPLEVSATLIRLSVGIEHADDLIADLDRALG